VAASPDRALPKMRLPNGASALALAVVLAALAARGSDASIHEYAAGGFAPRANSFFFHGGSEGLYASDASSNSSASFIRYALARIPLLGFDRARVVGLLRLRIRLECYLRRFSLISSLVLR
jgi:hypothetical protein